jgi:hypothetical protein
MSLDELKYADNADIDSGDSEGFFFEDKGEISDQDLEGVLKDAPPMEEEKFQRRKYWLSDYALKRVFANQNYICIFTGGTGTGKTYDAISFAHDIDPNFDASRIVFTATDFIKISRSGLRPGSVIIWDEAGVGISAREWFSIQNKVISYVLETFRRDNLILIMTTPHMKFIDTKVRALLHGYCETIDPTIHGSQFGWVKYFHITTSSRSGNTMFIYPRIKEISGKIVALRGKSASEGNIHFDAPPDFITEPYELKKKEFTEKLKDSALEEIDMAEGRGTDKLGVNELLDEFKLNPGKWGFYDENLTFPNLSIRIKAMMDIENPGIKIAEKDVKGAITLMKQMYNFAISPRQEILTRAEIPNIKQLILRFQHDQTARYYGVTPGELTNAIQRWKESGIWDDTVFVVESKDSEESL